MASKEKVTLSLRYIRLLSVSCVAFRSQVVLKFWIWSPHPLLVRLPEVGQYQTCVHRSRQLQLPLLLTGPSLPFGQWESRQGTQRQHDERKVCMQLGGHWDRFRFCTTYAVLRITYISECAQVQCCNIYSQRTDSAGLGFMKTGDPSCSPQQLACICLYTCRIVVLLPCH